jgi:hypothetical protein
MRWVPCFAILGGLFGLALAGPLASLQAQEEKPAPADSAKAVKQLVTSFYDNVSAGKADANLKLFLNEDVTVVGIARGLGAEKVWQKKAAAVIKSMREDGGAKHTIDSVEVELVDDALAVARVKLHTDYIKVRAVFTLTSEGGTWRIASYVFETRLPDQK